MRLADPHIFRLRTHIIQEIRRYFEQHYFLEVDTPIRIPVNAPEQYVDPIYSEDWVLQTSPETCMKRLLAHGWNRIFQMCKCFRQEEYGQYHLPEFTMLEWYETHITTRELMQTTQQLLSYLCHQITNGSTLVYQGHAIDFAPPFDTYTVADLFKEYSFISMEEAVATDRFDEEMGMLIAPQLGYSKPVFVTKYPLYQSVLAAADPANPDLADRFELYIAGMEISNGCTELTNKETQTNRFRAEIDLRTSLGKPAQPMPEEFLKDMSTLLPCAGNALGVDRLCMLFANVSAIQDIIFFPPEKL